MARPRIIPDGMAEWYRDTLGDGEATTAQAGDELLCMPLKEYSNIRARFLRLRPVPEQEQEAPVEPTGEAVEATAAPDTVAVPAALWSRVKEILNGAAKNESPISLGLRARPVMKEISRI